MKVTKFNEGYHLKVSDHEYTTLTRVMELVDLAALWEQMTTGERRSWSRRVGKDNEPYLRVDRNKRTW